MSDWWCARKWAWWQLSRAQRQEHTADRILTEREDAAEDMIMAQSDVIDASTAELGQLVRGAAAQSPAPTARQRRQAATLQRRIALAQRISKTAELNSRSYIEVRALIADAKANQDEIQSQALIAKALLRITTIQKPVERAKIAQGVTQAYTQVRTHNEMSSQDVASMHEGIVGPSDDETAETAESHDACFDRMLTEATTQLTQERMQAMPTASAVTLWQPPPQRANTAHKLLAPFAIADMS